MDFRTDRQTEITDKATDDRGFRPRSLFFVLPLLFILAVTGASEGARITVIVTDPGGEARLPARCCVIDSLGQSLYPYIYTSLYHTFGDGYFYSDGEFVLMVPEGPTVVRIAKGPEYRPFIDTLTVRADTTVTVVMERLADMRLAGWFSGDTHVHIDHGGGLFTLDPSDAHFMGMAEDLQFVNCLDNEFHFTGSPDPVSTEDCVVYMSEELRSFVYGHCTIPGLKSIISPYSTGWGTLLMDVADSVHAQDGPLMIYAHPASSEDFSHIEDWPGSGLCRELPLDLIKGKVDALDVMSYSNIDDGIALDLWYKLLDCGFRIPPTAGTDAAVNRLEDAPVGGFRVYVKHEGGTPDIYQWLDGIREGRTFVTNGPLFTEFNMYGTAGMGDSLGIFGEAFSVTLDVTVECAFPIERVDVIMNGHSVDALYTRGSNLHRISESSRFYIYESCWVALVARGPAGEWATIGDQLFAHTSPVYFSMNDEPLHATGAAAYFVEWTDSLIDLAYRKGEWQSSEDSIRLFSELTAARQWYLDRVDPVTSAEGELFGVPVHPSVITVHPNPFSGSTEIRFEEALSDLDDSETKMSPAVGEVVEIRIFDIRGRLVRRLRTGSASLAGSAGQGAAVWDGKTDTGREAASGIYFCRVRRGSVETSAKMLLVR
jgi:TolB protein